MNIYLYNYDKPMVFFRCKEVLKDMKYKIQYFDANDSLISATKGEGLCTLSSLLDLKISEDRNGLRIVLFSSTVSNIFGIIYHDAEGEKKFVENLMGSLQLEKRIFVSNTIEHDLALEVA